MNTRPNIKIVFCDGVGINENDGIVSTTLINVYEELKPYNIPGYFTFTMVLIISEIELSSDSEISITLVSPNGAIALNVTNLLLNIDNESVEKSRVQVSIDCRNILFTEEGIYNLTIVLNGENTYNDTIKVVNGV